MQVTPQTVRLFEQEQVRYGTKVAIFNLLFLVAYDLLQDADPTITGIKLKSAKPKPAAKRPRPR